MREVKTFSKSFADFRGTLSKEVDRQIRETYELFESSLNSVVQLFEERQATSEKKLNEEIKNRQDGEKKLHKEIKQVTSMTKSLGKSHVELVQAFAKQEKEIVQLQSFKVGALKREEEMMEELYQQKQQILQLFKSVEVVASESEGKVKERVISLSDRLVLLEEQQKPFKDKFYEMEMKIKQLERENEELKTTNHELQLKLEGFEAPPRHSSLGS